MKNLPHFKAVVIFLLLVPTCSYSQQNVETHFFSSFVINNETFNYEYKLTANQISSLKIDKITSASSIDTTKIKDNLLTINKKIEDNHTDWLIDKDTLLRIQSGISGIIRDIPMGINHLKMSNSQIDQICTQLNASISALKPDSLNQPRIAEIESLTANLQQLKNVNLEAIGQDKEAKFATFSPETIKSIVDAKLRNKFSIKLQEIQLNDLSQQIFYEISARRNFANDQPSTAFMRLHSDQLNGYFDGVKIIRKPESESYNLFKKKILPVFNSHGEPKDGPLDGVKMDKLMGQLQDAIRDTDSRGKKKKGPTADIALPMKFKEADFEFEAGTIKNIEAIFVVMINGREQPLKFRNNMPISITNKFTPEKLWNQKIYAANPEMLPQNVLIKHRLPAGVEVDTSKAKNYDLYFRLGDLIRYDIILANYREDYSPKDVVVKLSEQQSVVELKKQDRSKILTVKTYTDFSGINSEQPNGLIQLEASIGVNLRTQRHQSILLFKTKKVYEGIFTKADLTGHLSKIEENNKYLPLSEKDTVALSTSNGKKQFALNALELYRYKNTGIDFNLNLYKVNLASIMSNVQINGTVGIWRTGIVDSLSIVNNAYTKMSTRNERMITSTALNFNASYEFMPEDRYSFKVCLSQTWLNAQSPEIVLNRNFRRQIRTLSFEGFLNLNSENTSRLFFRWKLNTLASDTKINFNQVQLGYLVDVFKTNANH
ncbi:hypothetical protein ACSBL2_17270 [Pedobacter sp. AW31-3R]|uniref:hypothetical protein n=1 Tax=Pedobacter sp. AW31-3R TaxID=3445781 RepID=UPI003FA0B814